jgi:hypothetical protein
MLTMLRYMVPRVLRVIDIISVVVFRGKEGNSLLDRRARGFLVLVSEGYCRCCRLDAFVLGGRVC